MNISAAIITYNEARNIERCLNSLIGVADEIVVVDSGSTDATVDICRRYGCSVTTRPFTGYGSQRQYAAGLAHNRYVLSIDADEVLSDNLRQSLMQLKADGFSHRMYCFRVVNFICGKPVVHSGLQPDMQIRLFDKRYANWDLLDVGERLTYTGSVVPEPLEGDMYHFRCNEYGEYHIKEIRHAELRGRLMAEAGINAPMPMQWLRAACAYVRCQLRDGAILDGETGRQIALTRFRSTITAYRTARRIIKKDKN